MCCAFALGSFALNPLISLGQLEFLIHISLHFQQHFSNYFPWNLKNFSRCICTFFCPLNLYSLITYFGKYFILYIISWSFAMHIKALKTSFYSKETYFICSMQWLQKSLMMESFLGKYLSNFQNAMCRTVMMNMMPCSCMWWEIPLA